MGTGTANIVEQLLGKNPRTLSQADWEKVALSEEGIYEPMIKNYVDFRANGMLGPTLKIDSDGNGSIMGTLGAIESGFLAFIEKDHGMFQRRTGRDFNDIPSTSLGANRGEVLDSLNKIPAGERENRNNDYLLVSTGVLKPWAKQLDEGVIGGIESKNPANRSSLVNDVKNNILKQYPILKPAISKIWEDKVRKGQMTRYQVDKLKSEYF